MLEYPPKIKVSDFTHDDSSLPTQKLRSSLSRSANDLQTSNKLDVVICGVKELWVESIETGKFCKASFTQNEEIASATDQQKRFHFAPWDEGLKIHWKLEGTEFIQAIELELFRNVAGKAERLWLKRIAWDQCPAEGETFFNGILRDEKKFYEAAEGTKVEIVKEAKVTDFPDDFLTIEHSPYQLRLSIVPRLEQVLTQPRSRFLYLDVLVHSIKLEWGAHQLLPKDRPDIPDQPYRDKVLGVPALLGVGVLANPFVGIPLAPPAAGKPGAPGVPGYEETILKELRTANPTPVAGTVHQVILTSNLFAHKPDQAGVIEVDENFKTTTDFQEYKRAWGEGARIPLLAHVFLMKSDDTDTDQVPQALGNAKLFWDWEEGKPEHWKDALSAGAAPRTEPFLDFANNQHNQQALPSHSCNCPADFGGKKGSNSALFSPQDGTGVFPFEVSPCANRPWAVFSKFGSNGNYGKTGVILQPSRMAGDTYKIRASLYFDPQMDSVNAIQVPPFTQTDEVTFKVFRRIHVYHLVRGGPADLGCTPSVLQTAMKNHYLRELDMVVEVQELPVTPANYNQAIRDAIAAGTTDRSVYNAFPGLPLFLRHLVDMNPPPNSPGAFYRSKAQFEASVEQEFRNGKIQRLTAVKPEFLFEEIKGNASNAQGLLLRVWASTPPLILLQAGQPDFIDDEEIEGLASKEKANAHLLAAGNCWGHDVVLDKSAPGDKQFKEKTQVVFPDGSIADIHYEKSGFKKILGIEPTFASCRTLDHKMLLAGLNHNKDASFRVRIVGREDTDNAKERKRILHKYIEQLFAEFLIVDRKQVWERMQLGYKMQVDGEDVEMKGLIWQMMTDWGRTIRKDLADKFLLKRIITEYVKRNHADDEGLFLMHIPGESNGFDFPETADGNKPALYVGAAYAEATGRRNQTVVYLATLPPTKAKAGKSKGLTTIYNHEVAHALFMPHAPSALGSGNSPGGVQEAVHVKGDNCLMNYDPDSEHFCGFCMLRMRGWDWQPLKNDMAVAYEYQVTLELGDVHELFASFTTPSQRRKSRLQTLGLFNRPLDHAQSNDCFLFARAHAQKLFPALVGVDSTTTYQVLEKEIANFLVEGGQLPTPGQFAKIRIPGGFNVMYSQNMIGAMHPELKVGDVAEEDKYAIGANRYDVEQSFYDANPALGKIPLVVRVKRRPKGSGAGVAFTEAPHVSVYFQLIKPDPLPAYIAGAGSCPVAGGTSYHSQVTPPPLEAAPQKFLATKLQAGAATDPDANNAPVSFGGKRKGSNDPNVFCETHEKNFEPLSAAVAGGTHKFTSKVTTDAQGVAKLVFAPSRVGGDCYKLRAYVPSTPDSDGNLKEDGAYETGTMVRWRTVRICHYIQVPSPTDVTGLTADLQALADPLRKCEHDAKGRVCKDCQLREGALDTIDLQGKLTQELAKAYCELILEPGALAPFPLHPHGSAIIAAAKALVQKYPFLNDAGRNYNKQTKERNFGVIREPFTRFGASDSHFKMIVQSQKISKTTLTIRPQGGGYDDAILMDETGTLESTKRVEITTSNVNYDTGEVEIIFKAAQVGKNYDVCYIPDDYLDLDHILTFPAQSPYLFQMRLPTSYNKKLGRGKLHLEEPSLAQLGQPGYPKAERAFVHLTNKGGKKGDGLVAALFMTALTRGLDNNDGFYPGLMIFQAALMDNYSAFWDDGIQEGKGVENGIFIFGGNMYRPNDPGLPKDVALRSKNKLDTLALHEMSHGLYLEHAPSHQTAIHPSGFKENLHDKDDICVMCYDPNDGDYCGKCLASLRGINVTAIP